jgi:uncharacterized protein YodC (DUF2158 family)
MREDSKFKTGDLVQLKSGGPVMTVAELDNLSSGKSYWCHWFAGKKLEKGKVPEKSLIVPADDKESPK